MALVRVGFGVGCENAIAVLYSARVVRRGELPRSKWSDCGQNWLFVLPQTDEFDNSELCVSEILVEPIFL